MEGKSHHKVWELQSNPWPETSQENDRRNKGAKYRKAYVEPHVAFHMSKKEIF